MQTSSELEQEFLSPEFDGEYSSFPFAQVINDKRKSDCGFFITVENLGAADWQLPPDPQFHTATWSNGEESQGRLIHHPRLIILAQSPLLMFERSTGLELGGYDSNYYRRFKSEVVLKTKYLVYFVNEQNQPLHQLPMQLTMKGAAGASFGEHLRQFRLELEKAFAVAHQQPVKRKNAKFHALGVFCIQTAPQQRGEGQQTAWVCTTTSHEQPTSENWHRYFVGFTPLKEQLFAELENHAHHAQFGQVKLVEASEPTAVLPALPASSEADERELAAATASLFPPATAETTPATFAPSPTGATTATSVAAPDEPDIPF